MSIEDAIRECLARDDEREQTTQLDWLYRFVEGRVKDELTRMRDEGAIVVRPGFSSDLYLADGKVAEMIKAYQERGR